MSLRHLCLAGLAALLPAALAAGQLPPLYQTDFECAAAGLPDGWVAETGQWTLADDETRTLQQSQAAFRGLATVSMSPSNYDISVTVRPTTSSGQWGVGLVGYWQPGQGCYRLSNYGSILALWRERSGGVEALAAMSLELKPQAYHLRLALENEADSTVLRGKVWAGGEREPEQWMIVARDEDRPLRSGRAGFFTGRAAAIFSEFGMKPLAAEAENTASAAHIGTHWLLPSGDWQQQPDGVLRQNSASSTGSFRSGGYALNLGWSNCTIQVSAKAASGSRNQGFGLSAYRHGDGNYLQLGQMNGTTLFLGRRSEGAEPVLLTSAPFTFKRGAWYRLKLRLTNQADGVLLEGKAWPATAGEPAQWGVQAVDKGSPRLQGGDIGLWCLDDICHFDDLLVTGNQ